MEYITPTELARRAGVSKQAVFKQLEKNNLPFILQGKKKLIDADDPNVKLYIEDNPGKKEKLQSEKPVKPPSKKQTKKLLKSETSSEKLPPKIPKLPDSSKFEDIDPFEMKRRAQFADMRKRELQVLALEKKYLPIDFIDGVYIKYIENLNSVIERLAGTYITDIGKAILEAGEVQPIHIEGFIEHTLQAIDNNKKTIKKLIKNYEPEVKK
jgi:hypothetical protein